MFRVLRFLANAKLSGRGRSIDCDVSERAYWRRAILHWLMKPHRFNSLTRDLYSISSDFSNEPGSFLLKKDDLFCVLNDRGNIAGPQYAGLYYKDTRFLSSYCLTVNELLPDLVEASVAHDNAALKLRLSCRLPGVPGPSCTLFIDRTIYLSGKALCQRIDLHCDSPETVAIMLEHTLDCDFSDIFEVRANNADTKQRHLEVRPNEEGMSYHYRGQDAVQRTAVVQLEPSPACMSANAATVDVHLPPGQTVSTYLRVSCEPVADEIGPAVMCAGLNDLRRQCHEKRENAVRVKTQSNGFNAWLTHALEDLYMLATTTDSGPVPYAGLPWFSAPFGRDSIITALQTLWMDPSIARGVLGFLANTQARIVSPEHDAEPGKILHEARQGELSNIGKVPFRRYYGSADATPLFVFLAGEYFRRTGDRRFVSDIWPAIDQALRWIDCYGDIDGDGFVEYQRKTERGLGNQGWKDSVDSVFHADGSLAQGPIALCEVQAYVYGAKRAAAEIAASLGHAGTARQLADEAGTLQSIFDDRFWSDELNFYALALDGDNRQCTVRTSNAGHLLLTGIARTERVQPVADTLCGPGFFSGWGIRTVAESEARFDPLSYHNGSVWPHDTSLIAMGIARYGLKQQVDTLFSAMFEASANFDRQRLPELFSGAVRGNGGPAPFPHACAPQAWCAGVPCAFLGAILGIGFDALQRRVTFRNSRLPSFLHAVSLCGLGIGDATADVTVRAAHDGVEISFDDVRGDIEFTTTDDPGVRISGLA